VLRVENIKDVKNSAFPQLFTWQECKREQGQDLALEDLSDIPTYDPNGSERGRCFFFIPFFAQQFIEFQVGEALPIPGP